MNHHYIAVKNLDNSTVTTREVNFWKKFPTSSGSSISSDLKDHSMGTMQPPQPSASSVVIEKRIDSVKISRNSNLYSSTMVGSDSSVSSSMNTFVEKVSSSSKIKQGSRVVPANAKIKDGGVVQIRRFDIGIKPSGTQQHQNFEAGLI